MKALSIISIVMSLILLGFVGMVSMAAKLGSTELLIVFIPTLWMVVFSIIATVNTFQKK